MAKKKTETGHDRGSYMVLNGQRLSIKKHPTDFTVLAQPEHLAAAGVENVLSISRSVVRATAPSSTERDPLMEEVRKDKVAHHVYEVEGTGEEIVIDDRIFLNLQREGTGELQQIMQQYHLVYEGQMGEAHVLRLTNETGRNPVKLTNELAERDEVTSAEPQVLMNLQRFRTPALAHEQWYLDASALVNPDLVAHTDIDAPEAWEITTGDPEMVVAVIDDGFDLDHPAFAEVRIHPDKWNFANGNDDPRPGAGDYHGTPVASIAVGAHHAGSSMRGIAPNCTFLPIRIGFGQGSSAIDLLEVFRYVSKRADVVNCSFGLSPSSFDGIMSRHFRQELSRLCETGGRRGKGLVMVFSAANDDAPTYLKPEDNVNGVLYTRPGAFGMTIAEIPAGHPVFSGYPMTPGVITVGAMSSLGRKSGYSCWGPHLTVTAPSNNMHYIMAFAPHADARRARFVANYRGLGQVASVNRPGRGQPFDPILRIDDPRTRDLQEDAYTRNFGGTSGAAPVVSGVAALMLSVNPALTAQQVRQLLMATADQNLDFTLDLANDPNLQGITGDFVDGHSPYFGAGKVNAFRAVRRARALRMIANAALTTKKLVIEGGSQDALLNV